ncbi:MAG: HK97 gp10 family phage protein [Firmicutes bacterium]|nr:HK97 gp10 family phage protein [Bacillota bacterium]MBE3590827.1 HK97 gp10 family phage protein [Bacillota bacterium]
MAGAVRFRVKVEGGDLIARRLAVLGEKAAAVVDEAAMAGAEVIREGASRRAPVRTGALQEHIITQPGEEQSPGRAEVLIGPDKERFYGLFVELGTSKMAARPFLRPALDEDRHLAEAAVAAALKEVLGL